MMYLVSNFILVLPQMATADTRVTSKGIKRWRANRWRDAV